MIHFIGQNYSDNTTTIAIHGVRYEYFLSPAHNRTVEYLARRVSPAKALAFAKSRASRCDRIVIPVAPFPVAPPRKVS